MPIFEYRCRECGSKFEKIVIPERTEVVCEKCSSPQVDKLFSAFAVVGSSRHAVPGESGPCPCGALRRGMCGE